MRLNLIQTAELPAILGKADSRTKRRALVPVPYVRAVLLAIAVETRNGQQPLRLVDLARRAEMGREYFALIASHLAVEGIVVFGKVRRYNVFDQKARAMSVDFSKLEKLSVYRPAPAPRTADLRGLSKDPRCDSQLLEIRNEVIDELELSVESLKAAGRWSRQPQLHEFRALVVRIVNRRYKAAFGKEPCFSELARVLGVTTTTLKESLKKYEAFVQRGLAVVSDGLEKRLDHNLGRSESRYAASARLQEGV